MECFTHSGNNSVGICKTCGRAVCKSCAQIISEAVVCSEACGNEAAAMYEINQKVKKLYGIGTRKKRIPSGIIMWIMMAVFFLGFGTYQSFQIHEPVWFLLAFGAMSAIVACLGYYRAREVGLQC